MEFGLPQATIDVLKDLFKRYPQIKEVKIYGSRAMGTYKKGSDVDLALYGDISFHLLAKIASELDELPTPYRYDVTNYKTIENKDLKDHIDKVGKPFYARME